MTGIRRRALDVQGNINQNKAICALPSKLACICFTTLHDPAPPDGAARVTRKQNLQCSLMTA